MKKQVLSYIGVIAIIGLILLTEISFAQDIYCGQHGRKPYLKKTHLVKNNVKHQITEDINIPVIFHVIHSGEDVGTGSNISDAQIMSALEVLNEDFNRLNADAANTRDEFVDVAADIGIHFCPAKVDTLGNELEVPGIRRVHWQDAPGLEPPYADYHLEIVYNEIVWNTEKYYNIIILDMPVARGIAYFPANANLEGIAPTHEEEEFVSTDILDGIVLNYIWVGKSPQNPFPDAASGNGRVITHETGHWLGLLHISGDYDNCEIDDFCEDTPDTDHQHTGECPGDVVSCGTLDMWENYMDYSDGECMNLFTEDQKTRIMTALSNSPRRIAIQSSDVCGTTTGLQKINKTSNYTVYPNPLKGNKLFIQSGESKPVNAKVFIFSMHGTLLYEKEIKNDVMSIELPSFINKPGVYLVKIFDNNGSFVQKIIIE